MTPYEIMLSESQERMLLVVKKGREAEVERIFEKWDLHAAHIGEVTDDGLLRVREPRRGRGRDPEHARWWTRRRSTTVRRRGRRISTKVARARSVTARRPAGAARCVPRVARLADHREQALGLSPVRPHGAHQHARARRAWARASSASRARTRALAMSTDGNGRYCYLEPAARRDAGAWPRPRGTWPAPAALPIGATNCLNFGNPERPEIMWQFVEAVEGHCRSVPRARHSDHRRQRQPLQRNRRPARSTRRRSSASSA